ncbi:methyltransferase domain-containing protein [Fundidesulfovibrio terrae]|uniref:methyltransferase domain-containing protein n=1 Tax=Fundidesulfovibrio terrae TaxID=2922866 RepID=UPI001FAEDC2A|nr:methyltransferase domain-containing protein [Fundidesulfovibrio terrae]
MPTIEWLKQEFHYGYESGDVLAHEPDDVRAQEEKIIGGSYRRVAMEGMAPFLRPDSRALELGPGKGSWTRALLEFLPQGEVHVLDFQDVSQWLHPEKYAGRLVCHVVGDNSFCEVPEGYFDFFWSFGVLCHCNVSLIKVILANSLSRLKPGGIAVLQYGDWKKLGSFGWERSGVPLEFKNLPDDKIWWPRNDQDTMVRLAGKAGWEVVSPDLDMVGRDGMIQLRRPL